VCGATPRAATGVVTVVAHSDARSLGEIVEEIRVATHRFFAAAAVLRCGR
jgi:hypothetical protein